MQKKPVSYTHLQLGTRLADGLRRNDADGLALADQRAHCQVDTVAVCAHALARAALEHGTDLYTGDACCNNRIRIRIVHHLGLGHDHLAGLRVADIIHREAAEQALMQRLDDRVAFLDVLDPDALGRAAVVLADDNILRNVNQTAGQVTRVSGSQRERAWPIPRCEPLTRVT